MKYTLLLLTLVLLSGCSGAATSSHSSEQGESSSISSSSATMSSENQISSKENEKENNHQMKVKMTIEGHAYSISLNDSKAAKDFYDMLPLNLTLDDYNHTEKIADLPKGLDTSDSPEGTAAKKGDISFYAPWGNLAIFYQDFGYGSGLVNLGKIDQGSKMLTEFGDSFEVTFAKE